MYYIFGRVIDAQLSPGESPGLTIEEINERKQPGIDRAMPIISVSFEKVPIIAGGNLRFYTRDGEDWEMQSLKDSRQI
jgi:hypothetical protein